MLDRVSHRFTGALSSIKKHLDMSAFSSYYDRSTTIIVVVWLEILAGASFGNGAADASDPVRVRVAYVTGL